MSVQLVPSGSLCEFREWLRWKSDKVGFVRRYFYFKDLKDTTKQLVQNLK